MRLRALAWVRALGTAASQLWHVLVVGPVVVLLGGETPDPDETFSAMLARRAAGGAWWARGLAVAVDVLMWLPDGGRWGHCARAAAAHRGDDFGKEADVNGTWQNYAKRLGLGAGIALIFGLIFGAGAGFWIGLVWFWAKEAGEFSAKHWDAPGRPWADLNPFHERRTRDDRLDLLSGAVGALLGAVAADLL